MTRKTSATWAPTSVPTIRDRWLHGDFDHVVDVYRENIGPLAAAGRHDDVQFLEHRIADLLATRDHFAHADLYWASRDMTEFTASAAATLPEWTARAAMPSPSGFICWAKSPATTEFASTHSPGIKEMYTDMTAWHIRDDGQLQIMVGMRTDRAQQAANELGLQTPFLTAVAANIDPDAPIAGADEDGLVAPAALLAAAWLLMSQEGVTDTRRLKLSRPKRAKQRNATPEPDSASHEYVSLIELHHADSFRATLQPDPNAKGRHYTHRWWVKSHWRQQACGPGKKYRKPLLILPYIKGPHGTPLAADRVNVWRH